jgi:ribose 5-phosphate isomerase A
VTTKAAALPQDELKQLAGFKAVDDYVASGMRVGLGTGSTAAFAVQRLGAKLKAGALTNIVAVPTSVRRAGIEYLTGGSVENNGEVLGEAQKEAGT